MLELTPAILYCFIHHCKLFQKDKKSISLHGDKDELIIVANKSGCPLLSRR